MKAPVHSSTISGMNKCGIQLAWNAKRSSIESLFESGDINRDILQHFGFIVFDGHIPSGEESGLHTIPNQKVIAGVMQSAEGTQLLHHDGKGDQDVVLLMYPGKSGLRPADTFIGAHTPLMFEAFVNFYKRHSDFFIQHAKIPKVAEELRDLLAQYPIAQAGSMAAASSFNGLSWGEFLFQGFGTSVLGNPLLQQFYREAEDAQLVYRHRWQKNQAVLIDNQRMLHARVLRDDLKAEEADPTPICRRLFKWCGNLLVSII